MLHFIKSSITILLCYLLSPCLSIAQDIQWQQTIGGTQAEYLLDAIPTSDNGFIIAGSTLSNQTGNLTTSSKGNLDYWICKLDATGNIVWQKTYGGSGLDFLQSIQITPDSGLILAGISNSNADFDKMQDCKGDYDIWVIKTDASGSIEWQKTIGGTKQERAKSIIPTYDGGYIIGGSSASNKTTKINQNQNDPYGKSENSRGNLDYWVVKLDHTGYIQWQKTIGGKYIDELKSIITVPNNGGYLLGGYSNSPLSGDKTENNQGVGDYWIVKLNSSGDIVWQKTIGGDQDDDLFTLTATQDGGFVAGGNSNSSSSNAKSKANSNGTDYWVVKLTAEGTIAWQETYNFGKTDVLNSIIENSDGTLLIGGYAQSEASRASASVSRASATDKEGINDYIALKTTAQGETQWNKIVGSKGNEIMRKVLPTIDGGYLLAGTSSGKKSRDKTSARGGHDFWVVKVKDLHKIEEPVYTLGAHPNPVINETTITLNFAYTQGKASLFDLNGRLLQQFSIKGEQQFPMNLTNLPSGVYLVNIKTNTNEESIKIIKK